MYLKSIEMQGFKSFADKIRLEFHDGVTGIVGPNGSGKSNVADAVRWVLGEQSAKQMRGSNMQDVIFAGTQARKPLGFAYVALVLDNSDHALATDYDTVTVSRRLYRSGESEYHLNGASCRLRDIHELFYDTGIGKEGYSVIGQGQIDKILSSKPEDRRELFDEAAGIVKFKRRKAATLKKLTDEEQNLTRVTDILSELRRQVAPLEKQAEKAKIYLAKRDELKKMDFQLFMIENERLGKLLEETSVKEKQAEEELADVTAQFEHTGEEYDRAEREIADVDERTRAAAAEISDSMLKKQQIESQITLSREQIRAYAQNSNVFRERMEALDAQCGEKSAAKEAHAQDAQQLEEELQKSIHAREEKERILQDIRDRREAQNLLMDQGKSGMMTLLEQRASIRSKKQRYDTMLEQIGIRKSALSARMLQMKKANEQREKERKKLESQFAELEGSISARETALKEIEAELAKKGSDLTDTLRQIDLNQGEYHRKNSRLESLKELAERYEGYSSSIRKVMEQKDKNPGIHGVVADLIRTDRKYEMAIETALGGSLQNIVTDNENTAKYLIEYLKKGKFGRATFLPLTTAKRDDRQIQTDAKKEPGVIGVASDLVKCDDLYRELVRSLLGRTLVVDHIDHAVLIGRKYRHTVRMVTLEGELMSPGGSMTGGYFKNNSNLLGRNREIEDLEKETRSLKRRGEQLHAQADGLRQERRNLNEKSAAENNALQKLLLERNTAGINLESGREASDRIRREYEKLQSEYNEIEAQIKEIRGSSAAIESELEESRREEKALEQGIEEAGDAYNALLPEEERAAGEAEEARLKCASLSQRAEFLKVTMDSLDEDIRKLRDEQEELEKSLLREKGEAAEKEKNIGLLQETIIAADQRIEELKRTEESLRAEKEELNKKHRAFFVKRDELAEHKGLIDKECYRLRTHLEKLDADRESLYTYLYEEYQATPDEAAKACSGEELPKRETLRREISAVKNEIRDLGPVNVNAIEEYKDVKERHDFMSVQYEDLVKAADTLRGIISELDTGMRRQFRERFADISREFDKVFKELFGGGQGTLELTESEDVLEAGIAVISQPPGKKLQNMMQLSGGEKALTAIALLFAIQNLKPSPFCLLDEIEAALDDSNVGRFSRYLRKLTKNTQFIIITHRRGTMAAADRLYGITMQERGISTLVSVSLIEKTLDK